MIQPVFPRIILFWKAFREWYNSESSIPATVKTPPTMAHMFVAKCPIDL